MSIQGKNIGIAICGSFCTFDKIFIELQNIVDAGANVFVIMSVASQTIDTRFGKAKDIKNKIETIIGKKIMYKIEEAEVLGPKNMLDLLAIAPCTGNTLAKLANGITDGPVLMAAKGHLRNNKPLVIAVSTNDALGLNMKNIGTLMSAKNIYFVPFGQDNYTTKPNSMIADNSLLIKTIEESLSGIQTQPLIIHFS